MRKKFCVFSCASICASALLGCQVDPQASNAFEQALPVEQMIVIQSRGGKKFLLHQHDLDELQSDVLTQALAWKRGQSFVRPHQVPVDSQTIQTLLTLIRMADRGDRLRLAKELPENIQRRLCTLYDYLMCRGVFLDGVCDAACLYAPLLIQRKFLRTYAGQDSGLLQAAQQHLLLHTVPYVEPLICKIAFKHEEDISELVYSPDGKLLVSASWDRTVCVWNAETNELVKTLYGHEERVLGIVFSPDSKLLASYSADKTIRLWDMQTFTLIRVLQEDAFFVDKAFFSRDGKTLISCSSHNICLWDVANEKPPHFLSIAAKRSEDSRDIALSHDDKTLAFGLPEDGCVFLVDVATDAIKRIFYKNNVSHVALSPNGRWIASCCSFCIKIWHVRTGRLVYDDSECKKHAIGIQGIKFSNDSTLLLQWAKDGTVRAIDVERRKVRYTLQFKQYHCDMVNSLSLAPNGQMMAGAYDWDSGRICLWHTQTGKLLRVLGIKNSSGESKVTFSPDGKKLAFSEEKRSIYQVDLNGGLNVRQLMLVLKAAHVPRLYSAGQQQALEKIYHTLPEKAQEFVVSNIENII